MLTVNAYAVVDVVVVLTFPRHCERRRHGWRHQRQL